VGGKVYSVGVPLGAGDLPLRGQLAEILRPGSLDRILLQDTTGYAAELNRFGRADLKPSSDYSGIPAFPRAQEAAEAGFLLGLEGLSPETLREEAGRQDERIAADVSVLKKWLREWEAPDGTFSGQGGSVVD